MKKALVLLPAVALIAVSLYFVFTTSSLVRYWADDFCSAALLNKIGFWSTQINLFDTWTGRFSATFFISFFELIGPWVVRVLPILLLGLLIISLKKFCRVSKLLPVLFISLVLINAPNITQSLYWQTGSLDYIAPFIFLNIFLGLTFFPPKRLNLFLPAILLFVAGGFSEAYALAQLVLLVSISIGVKVTNFSNRTERMKIILSGIVGAVLVLGIMYLAPGNAIRATTVTHPGSLWFVIKSTLLGTKWYLLRMLSIKPFIYSLFFLFTSVLFLVKHIKLNSRDSLLLGILSIFAAVSVTAAVIGSGFYSMSIIPPERALFVAIYMIFICFAFFSFAVVSLIHKSIISNLYSLIWMIVVLNLITSFLLFKSVISNWSGVYAEVKAYAVTWDSAEKNLPILKNIIPVGGLDSFTDNKGWVASCLAGYYGFESVKIIK